MKHTQHLWLIGLGIVVCLACMIGSLSNTSVQAQTSTYSDDGLFTVCTHISYDGNGHISAYSDLQDDDPIDEAEILSEAVNWDLSSESYDVDGVGANFSSVSVPKGDSYTANFYYALEYEPFTTDGCSEANCSPQYDAPSGSADIYVPYPPPQINSISPPSDVQGASGTIHVKGQYLQDSGGTLSAYFHNDSDITVSVNPGATASDAYLTYSISPTAQIGAHQLVLQNVGGESEPVTFTVNYKWPVNPSPDPCAVTLNPQAGYSSIGPTNTVGGSGNMIVSFSGAAFAAVSPTVPYGPFSTPSSIAANVAALITKNYFQYGLSAKAFGPNVVYSGTTNLGTVTNLFTSNGGPGPSFTTSTSSTAAAAAENACRLIPQNPNNGTTYYRIVYKNYIPVDNIPGPFACNALTAPLTGLDYLGDKSAFSPTKYRIEEKVFSSTNPNVGSAEPPVQSFRGKTVNFAAPYTAIGIVGNPLPAITRGQFLESDPLSMTDQNPKAATYPWFNACNPPYENQFGYAVLTGVHGSSSSDSANIVSTEFNGSACDPLETCIGNVGPIGWDLTVSINTSNNTANINGWNTCYPAHQIWVNDRLIYDSQTLQDTTAYLSGCLTGILAHKQVTNCPVSLNTSQPCTPDE